ncbi:hypothetical protein HYW20_07200 [Candidatus Woesearchaeota archaeon]|nr:hypothetical protein [Candidatus Woesearchaeota archaeon]
MSEQTSHGEEHLMLNGVSLDEGLKKFVDGYLVHDAHGGTTEHPIIERQRRINKNVQNLESIVKDKLGESLRADEKKADSIIKNLAYQLAVDEGYKGKLEEFDDEKARKYLSQAGEALGNPTLRNFTEFKKSIINMVAAKPGDPLYDRNSPLAQFIEHIATQKDEESKKLNYYQSLLQEHATDVRYVSAAQTKLGEKVGVRFSPAANIPEIIGAVSRKGQLQSQEYAERRKTTYASPSQGHDAGAHASH